jgi:hypothetical protein
MLDWLKQVLGQKLEEAYSPWAAAILAECASADAVLDEALESRRAAERPLVMAAFQSLLAHAAWCALWPRIADGIIFLLYYESETPSNSVGPMDLFITVRSRVSRLAAALVPSVRLISRFLAV